MPMNWNTLLCKERPRTSTNPGDHRAEFERDYDRSVFSTPVKRLQDKAQVFPLDPNDAVRTRLTHSLEVSAVARGLATRVGQWLLDAKEIAREQERWIEAIAATCGLIHDLGNPPFGHSGEDAIREWFARRLPRPQLMAMFGDDRQMTGDFLQFEGNAQSLRLVTKLQVLADFHGLNLTYGTLSASCKYIAASHEATKGGDHARSKPGFFRSEQDIVGSMREITGTGPARNPITFLVEAADDIVYSVADIEDAVRKGIVRWGEVEEQVRALSSGAADEALGRMQKILKGEATAVPAGLEDDTYAAAFRTAAIGVVVASSTECFKARYDDIMKGAFASELVQECDASSLTAGLKQIGKNDVYCTRPNLKLELMGRRVIGDLMDVFWEGAQEIPAVGEPIPFKFAGKAATLMSQNYRKVFQHAVAGGGVPEEYCRVQLLCDYISGMTDSFATRLHAELFNGSE